jgi:alkylation response protein AidB-like acyl-CoA dehydrogenase
VNQVGLYVSDADQESDRILDAFEDALTASSDQLKHLLRPSVDSEEQKAFSAELLAWLYDGGWVRWGWPEDVGGFGGSATVRCQIYERLALRGYVIPDHLYVLEVCGPAVVAHAPALAADWLPMALRGEQLWCQGFSEPEAGSDLAALRTRANRDADGNFLVSGQKIWTSYGSRADKIVLLARTGTAESRHRGLTMMLVDLDHPGVERRPIAMAGGREEIAEIFFDEVPVDRDRVIGEVDGGWAVAMDLLQYERGNYAWMRMAATTSHLQELLASAEDRAASDPLAAVAIGRAYLSLAALRARTSSTLRRLSANEVVGAQTSVDKLLLSAAEQDVLDAALAVIDSDVLIGDEAHDARWRDEWWYSRAASVYGGAREIQHSIIADRILSLPKESCRGR